MVDVIVLNVQPPAGDLQNGGHPDLADPHLVDDLQLHSGSEDGPDAFPDLAVEVGGQGSSPGQALHQEVLPVVVLRLDCWKNKQSQIK